MNQANHDRASVTVTIKATTADGTRLADWLNNPANLPWSQPSVSPSDSGKLFYFNKLYYKFVMSMLLKLYS